MRIYKSFFRFEKCRKACKYRLYRLMRTYKEIVKNYILIYITFIHNGKLIMTVSKNDLVYNYAVMRCKENQFLALDPADIITYRKRDFQIDVLVSNGKEAQKKYKGVVVDHVSVDEIMLLLVKGERV